MLPWRLLDTARLPDGGEMRLYQRDTEYSIRVDTYELMNSRVHGSEDALASAACARLANRDRGRYLIGGLGMAYTLAAVLENTGPHAHVDVAELVPEVIEWNFGVLAKLTNDAVRDPRVAILNEDVADVIVNAKVPYDAILLDVDNGPAALTTETNDRLYTSAGLRAAAAALTPRGILGIWSSARDASFTKKLQRAHFEVEELDVRGHTRSRGPRYFIWLATPASSRR